MVLLPAPLGPMRPTVSPRRISKLTSSSAQNMLLSFCGSQNLRGPGEAAAQLVALGDFVEADDDRFHGAR